MPYATVSDVAIDYGEIADSDIDKVETLLERAEARIRQVFADLDDRLSDGRTTLVLVKQVESEMVAAVLRNPSGIRSVSQNESVGPFSRSTQSTYEAGTTGAGAVELTPRHRLLLGEVLSRGPFSLSLSGGR